MTLICIYVYIYIYIHTHTYFNTQKHTYSHNIFDSKKSAYMLMTRIHAFMHVCIHTHLLMLDRRLLLIYLCVCVCGRDYAAEQDCDVAARWIFQSVAR